MEDWLLQNSKRLRRCIAILFLARSNELRTHLQIGYAIERT